MLFKKKKQIEFAETNEFIFRSDKFEKKDILKLEPKYKESIFYIIENINNKSNGIFEDIKIDTIVRKLGKPTLDIKRKTLSYTNNQIDKDHIIEIVFKKMFEEIDYVIIDG